MLSIIKHETIFENAIIIAIYNKKNENEKNVIKTKDNEKKPLRMREMTFILLE